MLNPNIFQNFDLPYKPLPLAAYEAARTSILKRDFPQEAILDEYSFSSRSKEHTVKINALAFAHSIHRNPAEYASFTLYNAVNGQRDEALVKILAESAAPFHLIHRDNQFSFWASSVKNNQPEPHHVESGISYDQLDNVLSDYAADLKPQRIIDVKQGRDTFTIFHDIHPLQLSFWAADVTRDLLVNHFGQAVNELRSLIRDESDAHVSNEVDKATDLAIQLLGAIILADTGVLGKELRLYDVSLSRLLKEAQSKFGLYFQQDLFEQYFAAAEEAYRLLRQIRYAGFVPDMLRDLYMKAYSKEEQKESGSYDTPLYLTRRIWDTIPVEYLQPEQRIVVDMTCGWGSFLIAGHERLANLSDMQDQSLRNYLHGSDEKYFTARLAGLGLLLSTSEDSWHIDHEDALMWRWLNTHQPNIIVGNPPFRGDRKSLVGKQTRYQEADKFLEYAIERLAPNGYLAMLMPSSFMGAEASPTLRKQLLEKCDVLELWELPTEVFPPGIAVQTAVVFAQKKGELQTFSSTPVRVRTVQPKTVESFKNSGPFTASGIVVDQSVWNEAARKSKKSENTYIIDYRITLPEYTWREIESGCVKLHELAEVFLGAIEGKKPENKPWKDYPFPRQLPWLTTVKDVIKRPFFIDYEQATTIIYPNDLEKPRKNEKYPEKDKEKYLKGTKILVASDPHPSWGRAVKVAIERKGYFVSNSFWVIVPITAAQNRHITHEVLAAVLSWHVSNAWIVGYLRYPWIPERAINTVPIPSNLSEDDCGALTEAVRKIEAAAFADRPTPSEAIETIDAILKAAYHLDDATFERLRKITEWNSKSEITLDIQPDRNKANWFTSGIVDRVDAEQGSITFWIDGFDELQTVKIIPSMPGWILRPGAAFFTKIPDDWVEKGRIDQDAVGWGIFRPQPYMYMSEDELLEEVSKHFIPR